MKFFLFYFSLFIIISFLGWICEIIYIFFETKKINNRGFLIGPYCPIYGAVSVIMYFLLEKYQSDLLVLFILSSVICTIAEYLTSYAMEKIFKARWWDYTHMKFNINGRVCLLNSILFGIGTLALFKIILPFLIPLLQKIPTNIFFFISGALLSIFILDLCISCNIIFKFKNTVEIIQKDYTGEISEKVRKVLMEKSYPLRRLVLAFPNQVIHGIKKSFWRKK